MFSCCFQHPERNLPGVAFDSKAVLALGMRQQQINRSTDQRINPNLPLMIFIHGCTRIYTDVFLLLSEHPERCHGKETNVHGNDKIVENSQHFVWSDSRKKRGFEQLINVRFG